MALPREIKLGKFYVRRFYSICSGHMQDRADCLACNTGMSHWFIADWVSHYFYKRHRRFWLWYVNRPNSKTKKRLKEWFPNLR